MSDIPLLTGRIEAWPVVLFTWACPKCNGMHARVARGSVVECLNPRCGEKFDRTMFRFNDSNKIERIMGENAAKINAMVNKNIEDEAAKAEAVA